MRRQGDAAAVAQFLADATDDTACRWLALNAGRRTRVEREGVKAATHKLAPSLIRPLVPLDLRRVR